MKNNFLNKLFIFAIVVVPLAYGLMPNTDVDKYGNPISANTEPSSHGVESNIPDDKSPAKAQSKSIFPAEILGMALVDAQEGQDAMQGVSRLHGLDIELKNAYIATYQKGAESAIIWISESKDEVEAKQLFAVMDEKMPNNSTFTDYHEFNIKGQEYRYVFWPERNMHNYYYIVGTKNYWVAVASENPMPFLAEVLKSF